MDDWKLAWKLETETVNGQVRLTAESARDLAMLFQRGIAARSMTIIGAEMLASYLRAEPLLEALTGEQCRAIADAIVERHGVNLRAHEILLDSFGQSSAEG